MRHGGRAPPAGVYGTTGLGLTLFTTPAGADEDLVFDNEHQATCASRERTWATLLFDALDADGDGTLTETELWAAGLDASGLDAATYAPCDDSSSRRRLDSEGKDSATSAPDSLGSRAHNFVVEESERGHRRLDDAPTTVAPTPVPTFAPTRR